MKRYAIIVAGGSGQRLGAGIPKQFLLLEQKPVLIHTIEAFYRFDEAITILLVLPENYLSQWQELVEKYKLTNSPLVVTGGKERFFSVKNALNMIADDKGIVVVHDGVRPLVPVSLIESVFEAAKTHKAVVPVLPLTSSIREKLSNGTSRQANRNRFVIVQTPQGFHLNELKKAYRQPFAETFTDDASVVEQSGVAIHLIQGEPENVKITTPSDLLLAAFYLSKSKTL